MIEHSLRRRILRDTFSQVDRSLGVALVGILFDFRIELSPHASNMTKHHGDVFTLEPLDPQAAAELVGDMYGIDPDQLYLAFQQQWTDVRKSPPVSHAVAKIAAHELVEELEQCSSDE